jgi:hypothetical protein
MQRYAIRMVEDKFHIDGFPDSVKAISISGLLPNRSRELSSMPAHRLDLVFAKACLDFLKSGQDIPPVLRDALWRSAIVHYCKCFGKSGSRRVLPYTKILPVMADAEAQPREIHKHFIALRNRHVVHDDNAWLQILTGAIIAAPGKGYHIEMIVSTSFQGQTLEQENFGNLYLLIEHALSWVGSRFDELSEEITAELEKVPRETLLAQPDMKYRAPEAHDVDSPRPQD